VYGCQLARQVVPLTTTPMPSDRRSEKVPHLTPREMEVLLLLCRADCLLEKEMLDVLHMSLSTFKTHKEHLFALLGVDSRQKLIAEAVRLGMALCYCQQLRAGLEPSTGDAVG